MGVLYENINRMMRPEDIYIQIERLFNGEELLR